MSRIVLIFSVAFIVTGGVIFSGCSSSPSDEELRQLDALKSEVTSLEKQVGDKQREQADLEKQIAGKNGKLQQCQADQDAVKKALGGK